MVLKKPIFKTFIDFKFKTKSSLNHKIQFEPQVGIQCLQDTSEAISLHNDETELTALHNMNFSFQWLTDFLRKN